MLCIFTEFCFYLLSENKDPIFSGIKSFPIKNWNHAFSYITFYYKFLNNLLNIRRTALYICKMLSLFCYMLYNISFQIITMWIMHIIFSIIFTIMNDSDIICIFRKISYCCLYMIILLQLLLQFCYDIFWYFCVIFIYNYNTFFLQHFTIFKLWYSFLFQIGNIKFLRIFPLDNVYGYVFRKVVVHIS